jgi:pSer/pThr/pTyr-binding forkhead associated (FHA) protein
LSIKAILQNQGGNFPKNSMAKFTVYFKDKAIQTTAFESGVVHIGRDDTNDVVVDSLAVAPVHAVVVIKDGSCFIKQMNDRYPLLVNNRLLKECNLLDNDVVNIGKHYIVFNKADALVLPGNFSKDQDVSESNLRQVENFKVLDANLQILEGEHIGRILPLKKAMTRLGREGCGIVVITRRKDGFFISALEENQDLRVNDLPLDNKIVKLQQNDVIIVDNIPMQFFLD